jgi:hypothetical protein
VTILAHPNDCELRTMDGQKFEGRQNYPNERNAN